MQNAVDANTTPQHTVAGVDQSVEVSENSGAY